MRILVDYRPALRERTGVGEFVHELTKAVANLATSDHITLFTSSWKDRPSPALASEMPAAVRIVDAKVPVRVLTWAWNRLEWPTVERFAGEQDVVHSQSPMLIPARAAKVVTIHDLDFLKHPQQMTAEIRRDYPALARSHAARADAVMVSSRYAAAEVIRELQVEPSRVHVCSPGPPLWTEAVRDARVADAGAAPRGEHLLFVGTLNERKNVGTLLKAYRVLRERVSDAPPLVLAGHRTPAFEQWAPLCNEGALRGHVTITGYVDTARRVELYQGAHMLILPSYDEGFGLPVLEAMACGVPVVISSRGSLPEVAGDAAVPIDPNDVDGFATAMQALLDPDRARAAITQGVSRAATYNWTTGAIAARQAYQSAIEVHARRH